MFAAEHYAHQVALPSSQRRPSALPASRKDAARKALERIVKPVLPGSHRELIRAIEREARDYDQRQAELAQAAAQTAGSADLADDSDATAEPEVVDGEDVEEEPRAA